MFALTDSLLQTCLHFRLYGTNALIAFMAWERGWDNLGVFHFIILSQGCGSLNPNGTTPGSPGSWGDDKQAGKQASRQLGRQAGRQAGSKG